MLKFVFLIVVSSSPLLFSLFFPFSLVVFFVFYPDTGAEQTDSRSHRHNFSVLYILKESIICRRKRLQCLRFWTLLMRFKVTAMHLGGVSFKAPPPLPPPPPFERSLIVGGVLWSWRSKLVVLVWKEKERDVTVNGDNGCSGVRGGAVVELGLLSGASGHGAVHLSDYMAADVSAVEILHL